VHSRDKATLDWFLKQVGTNWYLADDYAVDNVPAGFNKLLFVGRLPGPSDPDVRTIAGQNRGATWSVVNEPNRPPAYDPREIAGGPGEMDDLHDLYTAIRRADPTARLLSPPILNFTFTCTLCAGYTPGRDWLTAFRDEYRRLYGAEPAVDAWALNVYPLDWEHIPTVNSQLAIEQIVGFRNYLDSVPELRGKPIWITELGLHWGWDAWRTDVPGCTNPSPSGTYRTDLVLKYLTELFDWLDANAQAMNIQKVFVYVTYRDITKCSPDAYAGMTLFDGPQIGATLTDAGKLFRDRVAQGK
jgi:hypothetical protein